MLVNQRFQPALRIQAPERVAAVTLNTARTDRRQNKVNEGGFSLFGEPGLISWRTENDFLLHAERARSVACPQPGKFQAMQTKRNVRRREHSDLSLGASARTLAMPSANRLRTCEASGQRISRVWILPRSEISM